MYCESVGCVLGGSCCFSSLDSTQAQSTRSDGQAQLPPAGAAEVSSQGLSLPEKLSRAGPLPGPRAGMDSGLGAEGINW